MDSLTLKALLIVSLTLLRDVEYRFCRTPDCPTVYYSVDGLQRFEEKDVRERVYQKHPTDDAVFVCYCFRHTVGSIEAEFAKTRTSTVVAAITAGIQAGQCACEIRNPQGSCCLGNAGSVAQHLEAQTRQHAT
ncbi:MAG: hypothetical protein HYZ81_10360 [Nitrospinae bacterium]|nr:hypothetical protein [Nitrospinota bacterium]